MIFHIFNTELSVGKSKEYKANKSLFEKCICSLETINIRFYINLKYVN